MPVAEIRFLGAGRLKRRRRLIRAITCIDVAALTEAAKGDPRVAELLAGKTIVKTIAVPGRMVNFVVK